MQKPWLPAGKLTARRTNKKSSSLPKWVSEKLSLTSSIYSTGSTLHCHSRQVLLPLIDQYFKNHSLYFLSSPNKNLSSSGYASNKEKEMVTRYRSALQTATASEYEFPTSNLHLLSPPLLLNSFSLFCKLAALVRHRISLFGELITAIFPAANVKKIVCRV